MVDKAKPHVRYGDPSHADLNAKRKLTKTPAPFDGPWIKPETLARLPNIARDFQINRDPLIAKQVHDLEGDGDGAGRGVAKKNDKPKPELKPPLHMRQGIDQSASNDGWLIQQCETAMKSAARPNHPARTIERARDPSIPQRGRTPNL